MKTTNRFFASVAFAELTLRVRDLARVTAFYRDTLGFRVVDESAQRVALSPDGAVPALVVLESAPLAEPRRRGTAGLFHVAFLFPDRGALGRIARRLVEGGVRPGGADHGVSEAIYLEDPEGNGIELYADRAVDAWPAAGADGQVTMFTGALDFESLIAEGDRARGELMPANTRIGHVHLSVSDLSRAEIFYAGVLGFPVRQRSYPGALFLGRDGYHHHFGTNVWQSRAAAVPGAPGLARFGLRFAASEGFSRVLDRARENSRVVGEEKTDAALVRDFDGIEVELSVLK